MTSSDELRHYHSFVCDLLIETREQIQAKMESGYFCSLKEDLSEVTEVDRSIEIFLRDEVQRHFPTHNFVGEEHPPRERNSDLTWYVDPIDGTQNFTHLIPTFGTIIALHQQGRPIVCAIDHPELSQTYSAALGVGAYLNKTRLQLADLPAHLDPRHELITVSSPAGFDRTGEIDIFLNLAKSHHNLRVYGDCFSQTCAFSGRAGASVQFNVKAWDIAAARLLIEEAGGKALLLRKNETHPTGPYFGMILGKKRVVDYLRGFFESCLPEDPGR